MLGVLLMNAPEFTFDPALVDRLDASFIDAMARDLAITPHQARECLRDGVRAGLLSIAATTDEVVIRGEFPPDVGEVS